MDFEILHEHEMGLATRNFAFFWKNGKFPVRNRKLVCTEVSRSGHWRDCREVAAEKQCVKISKKKLKKPKQKEAKE